jgi:hypothetical protein
LPGVPCLSVAGLPDCDLSERTYGRSLLPGVGRPFLCGLLIEISRNISGMFNMSADDAGWLITLIVAVVLIAIIVRASWR